jgi:phosphonoacetaldehyde hydrolase
MSRRLCGVVFDWAGTVVDHGSLAPVKTLERVFAEAGVEISESEARRDMGIAKRSHIAALLQLPRIAAEWQRVNRREPSDADIEQLYARFIPLQLECLAEYSALIAEAPAAIQAVRRRNLKVGTTTGYTRPMLELLLQQSAREGFIPDCALCPDDVGQGRPYPFMLYETAVRLKLFPLSAVVKVGDTVADIEEGMNAGSWTVGVIRTGNAVGLSLADWKELSSSEQRSRLAAARVTFQNAGAHFVIDDLSQLDDVLAKIEWR